VRSPANSASPAGPALTLGYGQIADAGVRELAFAVREAG
jgi:hypothetical protein